MSRKYEKLVLYNYVTKLYYNKKVINLNIIYEIIFGHLYR